LAAWLAFPMSQSVWGADKVRYGTALKGVLYYDLPMIAGLEKGLFKQAGVEVDWVPFKSGTQMHRAIAAKAIDIGISSTIGVVRAIVRGTPSKLVAEFPSQSHFLIWVKGDGPIKKPADLKGKKMGISRFGGSGHAFTLAFLRGAGLEKDVKIVAVGGASARVAALKTDVIAAFLITYTPVAAQAIKGELRPIGTMKEYLPKQWMEGGIEARNDYLKTNAQATRNFLTAQEKSVNFVRQNRAWTLNIMQSKLGLSKMAAEASVDKMFVDRGFKLDPERLENVVKFLLDYKILKKKPVLKDLYTAEIIK
jgi:ABC-type nitrate/sulfonate/bicarbonate transport system substrate-binding protein